MMRTTATIAPPIKSTGINHVGVCGAAVRVLSVSSSFLSAEMTPVPTPPSPVIQFISPPLLAVSESGTCEIVIGYLPFRLAGEAGFAFATLAATLAAGFAGGLAAGLPLEGEAARRANPGAG